MARLPRATHGGEALTARGRVLAFALVVMLAGVGAFAPVAAASPTDTVGVSQAGTCYETSAYGDGTTAVEDYYDYNASGDYSSQGTTHLQRSQQSQLFVYNGSQGLSLVVLHDQYGDGEEGGAVSFDVYGLPESGEWAVEDDNYDDRDDNFNHTATTSHIDWMWSDSRNDGGAYRGLNADYEEITIVPGFNEEADAQDWPWAQNETTNWFLRTSTDSTVNLSMNQNVTIAPACAGNAPNASLTAPGTAGVGENVTLDASDSTDDHGVAAYHWDVDGDGENETATQNATLSHAYDAAGNYTATVTVVDDAGQSDAASATVNVSDTTPPAPVIEAPDTATVNQSVAFDSSNSTDNGNVTSYEWEFGDGANATGAEVTHTYDAKDTYTVTLTATDEAGNTNSTTATVNVTEPDTTAPDAALDAPATAPVGENVTLDGSNSTDDREVTEYRWDLDGDGSLDRTTSAATIQHAFQSTGEQQVGLTVADAAGNTNSTNATVNVTDSAAPTAAIDAPENATAGQSVTFDGSGSSDDGQIRSYEWTFGDGTNATGETVSHTYESNGTYEVTLTVTDGGGNTDTANATVEVAKGDTTPPTFTFDTPDTVTVDEKETYDIDSNEPETFASVEWDYGDGASGSSMTDYHRYDATGEYTVTVTVTDESGNEATKTTTVEVISKAAAQPSVTIDGPSSATAGESVSFTADAKDDGSIDARNWTFGDGTAVNGQTVTHAYDETGDYTVQVTVTDDDGNTASDSLTVSVEAQSDDGGSGDDGSSGDDHSDDGDQSDDGGDDTPPADDGGSSSPPASDDGSSGDDSSSDDAADAGDTSTAEVDRTGTGAVEVTVASITDAGTLVADLPANYSAGDVQFERLTIEHGGLDEFRLELNATNASDAANVSDGETLAVLNASGSGLDQAENATVNVTVPASAVEDAGENSTLALFALEDGNWTRLETNATDAANGSRVRLTATAGNLTTIAVAEAPSEPATDAVSVTSVSAEETGDGVEITVEVANDGDAAATYTVPLTVDGEVVATRNVTVPANGTETVTFTREVAADGTHTAEVGGTSERFSVWGPTATPTASPTATGTAPDTPTNTGGQPGFGLAAALIAISVAALLRRRR